MNLQFEKLYSEEKLNEKASNEAGIDTDWYLLDSKRQIAIVASAGGLLPESVSSDRDSYCLNASSKD
ncbi:MAG TPA: hypothetical protein VM802_11120 [Chitinophaga sp.]|uniref:hypothetical protein n=1 Tax=Chitinophaga sp. TaxID=1869181 RepID=UPI002B61BC00|nr:hypothetical protein [Chitinophaga sp.]HVI45417.1 hypothetical protein [Chitinophaga sp.]